MKGAFAGVTIFAGGLAAGLVIGTMYGAAIERNK